MRYSTGHEQWIANDSRIRERAVLAVNGGMSRATVSAAFGVDRVTLYRWLRKYESNGGVGLERRAGSGRPGKLEEHDEGTLWSLVLKGPLHFGYETDPWTVSRLRRVITEAFSIVLSKNTSFAVSKVTSELGVSPLQNTEWVNQVDRQRPGRKVAKTLDTQK